MDFPERRQPLLAAFLFRAILKNLQPRADRNIQRPNLGLVITFNMLCRKDDATERDAPLIPAFSPEREKGARSLNAKS